MLDGAPILGVSSFHALDDVGPASLNGLLTGPAFDLPGGALVEFAEPPQQCVYPEARRSGSTAGHCQDDADDLAIERPRTVPDHHLGHCESSERHRAAHERTTRGNAKSRFGTVGPSPAYAQIRYGDVSDPDARERAARLIVLLVADVVTCSGSVLAG